MRTHAERIHATAEPDKHEPAIAQRRAPTSAATHHFANIYPDVPVPRSGGAPIPSPLRARMERSFGAGFGDVRVHQDGNAERVGALAYTRGTNVHIARGRFNPESAGGAALLGHELAHVVQQKQNRVETPQGKGAPINADPSLEAEADRLGADAASGKRVSV